MHDYSFYSAILGLCNKWRISNVTVDSGSGNIELHICATSGSSYTCTTCGAKLYSRGEGSKARWLHTYNSNISFYISAKIPRVICDRCGEIGLHIPWGHSSVRCDGYVIKQPGDAAPGNMRLSGKPV